MNDNQKRTQLVRLFQQMAHECLIENADPHVILMRNFAKLEQLKINWALDQRKGAAV